MNCRTKEYTVIKMFNTNFSARLVNKYRLPILAVIVLFIVGAVFMFVQSNSQTNLSNNGYEDQRKETAKAPLLPMVSEQKENLVEGELSSQGEVDSRSLLEAQQVFEQETANEQGSGEPLNQEPPDLMTITLAGGCFWCVEGALQDLGGVVDAVSGYAGGSAETANYLAVSDGGTKHREVVQVTYDANVISTEELLNKFWSTIDPTDPGGQFADRGFQYTTAIYYHTDDQKDVAEASIASLNKSGLLEAAVVTEVVPYTNFFRAESYHQDYYQKSAERYKRYEVASGRAGFVAETWARDEARAYFEARANQAPTAQSSGGEYDYTDEEIAELLKNLDPLAYHVVAENGTESPFNNQYWDNTAAGIYVDIVTGEPLFSSTHKYDSGTGWPSFWRTIDDDSVTLHEDNSLSTTRTEVRSAGGHVGHVFDDGLAAEGGRRFCTNSASLLFVPKEEMEAEGYGEYLYLFKEV